ncbi:hypothetical protein [Burkholderia sp. Ac-20365]|jgi:hypothetical protein|uniref:hypothetical protein n=1 Tax=Burkholderia sp. Ac-20365 TaxID=2703897 RepID=UPI00197C9C57|nr:hypothetical protein [Burkholderia sp. Ac-20365]MBN3763807.1 hypothetical protein [Burkholderia sp. Ac-20365]
MQKSVPWWQLVLTAALIAANAHSSNAQPQKVTVVVEEGIVQSQVIATLGP